MATNTKSYSFSMYPPDIERIEARVGLGENRSSRLAIDLDSFYSMLALGLARAKRQFTQAEAELILDVQNGTMIDGSQLSLWLGGGLAHQVSDGIALNGLDAKWEIDGPAMVKKIQAMSDIETMGILDWAARFWGRSHKEENTVEQAVAGFLEK